MGCAQSRNGEYWYPSFLEGPPDRINSNDPQSAVDFVDRVLDQIDLALDGERPEPTRQFTSAEVEVVETAWRNAGLHPGSKISLRQFQALLPMILSAAPFQGLDLDVLQEHISAVRLSQKHKNGGGAATPRAPTTQASPAPPALPVPPAAEQQDSGSGWQEVLNDPGGGKGGVSVRGAAGGGGGGGWPTCSSSGGAAADFDGDSGGLGGHQDQAQLTLATTMRVLARLLAPAEESTQPAADVGHAVSALLLLEEEGVVVTASESLSCRSGVERKKPPVRRRRPTRGPARGIRAQGAASAA